MTHTRSCDGTPQHIGNHAADEIVYLCAMVLKMAKVYLSAYRALVTYDARGIIQIVNLQRAGAINGGYSSSELDMTSKD